MVEDTDCCPVALGIVQVGAPLEGGGVVLVGGGGGVVPVLVGGGGGADPLGVRVM